MEPSWRGQAAVDQQVEWVKQFITNPALSLSLQFSPSEHHTIVKMVEHEPEPKRFEPKVPVQLDPPKDDPISQEELAKCDGKCSLGPPLLDHELICLVASHTGTDPNRPTLVAIKGTVFDVSRNAAYGPSGQYRGKFRRDCGAACTGAVSLTIELPSSLRRQGSFSRLGYFVSQTGGLRA